MIYDADGVNPDPTKCAEIQTLPSPKNMTELQQFLGIVHTKTRRSYSATSSHDKEGLEI